MRVACIQLNSQDNVEENIKIAADYLRKAKENGAELAALPENFAFMRMGKSAFPNFDETNHPAIPVFTKLCKELKLWLVMGSINVRVGEKFANRSYLISSSGELVAYYDKIHLFDVELPNGEKHLESHVIESGNKAVVAETDFCKLGMTICYDVRFPHLYRELAIRGAKIIAIPAAFTRITGEAHWEVLLRARAIETGSFVVAPAQCGAHGKRETYGHSMIIDPWGKVLAEAGTEPGLIYAEIDLGLVDKSRAAIPNLLHYRKI